MRETVTVAADQVGERGHRAVGNPGVRLADQLHDVADLPPVGRRDGDEHLVRGDVPDRLGQVAHAAQDRHLHDHAPDLVRVIVDEAHRSEAGLRVPEHLARQHRPGIAGADHEGVAASASGHERATPALLDGPGDPACRQHEQRRQHAVGDDDADRQRGLSAHDANDRDRAGRSRGHRERHLPRVVEGHAHPALAVKSEGQGRKELGADQERHGRRPGAP
jgi:hypothetical protein